MKFILLLTAIALFSINAFAQPATVEGTKMKVVSVAEAQAIAKIKTSKGLLVISNEPGNVFSFEIRGKKISSLPGGPLRFSVDGKYLELFQHDKAPFVAAANKKDLTELEILEWHRQWYLDQVAKTFNTKLDVESIPLKIKGDKDVLKWSFPMPPDAGYKNLKRQSYLSIVQGDKILMFNSAWTTEIVEYKEISQLLWNTMTSLVDANESISNQ
jgi:hypothetical protein